MPKLTPAELQAARKHREEERLRKAQEAGEQRERERQRREAYVVLDSSAHFLYVEMDKLTKKTPKEQVSDLNLDVMNDIIRKVKQLIPGDPQLARITVFEAAGDNPEYRDALLVVSQVRAALERFQEKNRQVWSELDRLGVETTNMNGVAFEVGHKDEWA